MFFNSLKTAVEGGINTELLRPLLSNDVKFYTPFLSLPLIGIEQTIALLEHMDKNTDWFEIISEHKSGNQYCMFWKDGLDNQILNTVAIFGTDGQGSVKDLSMFMGPLPTLNNFVYKLDLGEIIVNEYWSPRKDWSKTSNNILKLSELNIAEDVSFSVPFLLKPVFGKNEVESMLRLMETVMNFSYQNTLIENSEMFADQFSAEADGFTLSGILLIKSDQIGNITDLVMYLSPRPMMEIVRGKCQAVTRSNPEFSFLSENFWTSPGALRIVH